MALVFVAKKQKRIFLGRKVLALRLSYIISLLFIVLSVVTIPAAVWYSKIKEGKRVTGQLPDQKEHRDASLSNFWEVQDIKEGIITLKPGNRYRAICRISAQDFYLLGDAEQNGVEDVLRSVMIGLDYPVQVLVTSEAVDTKDVVAALRENAALVPGKIAEHAILRAEYLENTMMSRMVSARTAYLVVPYDTDRGFERARGELHARISSLMGGFAGAKMRLEMLDSAAVCDLLAHLLNRGRVWKPSLAVEEGIMADFHVSANEAA